MSAVALYERSEIRLPQPAPPLVVSSDLKDRRHLQAAAAPELEAWKNYLDVANRAPSTLEEYERIIAALLREFPGLGFGEFTDAHLLELIARQPRGSRRHWAVIFNQWFKWGRKTGRIAANPCDLLPPMADKPNRSYDLYSPSEAAALCALPQPDGALWGVLLWCGLRMGEARELTAKRVDFTGDQPHLLIVEGAKGSKQRRIPIIPPVAQALDDMIRLDALEPDDYLWYRRAPNTDRLFREKPVSEGRFYLWTHECHDEARVRYRRPHLARHTMATRWSEIGLPLEELSQILGHESPETTTRTYIHKSVDLIGQHMAALSAEIA